MKKSELKKIIREEIENLNVDDIDGSNYLTPTKKEIDNWSEDDKWNWFKKSSDSMYGAQTRNDEKQLDSLVQADNAVRNYLGMRQDNELKEQSYITNNQYVESKIVRMIKSFSKEMEITPWEAHNLVRDIVGKLTDSFGEGRYN